jgi:hypothetical protein
MELCVWCLRAFFQKRKKEEIKSYYLHANLLHFL